MGYLVGMYLIVWVCECVSACVTGSVGLCLGVWVVLWVFEWVCKRLHGCVNGCYDIKLTKKFKHCAALKTFQQQKDRNRGTPVEKEMNSCGVVAPHPAHWKNVNKS